MNQVEERHIPVLGKETIELLAPERGGVFIDATLGMGGHTALLLARAQEAGKSLNVLGIDQDVEALGFAKSNLRDSIRYAQGNFAQLMDLAAKNSIAKADGILMDLGVSSYQIDTPARGFSFAQDGPLDMRMDQETIGTAAALINSMSEYHLANLLYEYGEERFSRRIAAVLVQERKTQPFTSTKRLADLLVSLYPAKLRYLHPHPATRTFQALRIAVNDELGVLEQGIAAGLELLAPGGICAIISFHSLEDRIVKHRFRDAVHNGGYELLNRKPIEATAEERALNPRSRSAKLRGIRRMLELS